MRKANLPAWLNFPRCLVPVHKANMPALLELRLLFLLQYMPAICDTSLHRLMCYLFICRLLKGPVI